MEDNSSDLVALTTEIVGAFIGNNSTSQADLPALIAIVHRALRDVDEPEVVTPAEAVKATTAQIRRSITPDALISFEDGRRYKALKRHLTSRGMTPADYRAKWGLPNDYPTTAPAYSAMRSQMAKSFGLGQLRGRVAEAPAASAAKRGTVQSKQTPASAPAPAPTPARRGRPKKASKDQ